MTLIFDQYDLKGETALLNDIAGTVLQLPWFEKAGHYNQETETKLELLLDELHVHHYEIEWISKNTLAEKLNTVSFGDSKIWKALKELPTIYTEKIEEKELEEAWNILLNDLPEHLFHFIFEKAYELYQNEEEIHHLINQAYYVSTLIALAKLAGEEIVADKLTNIIETGNVVVGFQREKIYLL
ncbi:hypothetical protein [Pseudogracilibacillus sp. SO30301A]|uniref:hypothetical protein n=1 Tax=Pseudogracilibacillus sp. SO30301A TaxID=3098291 RepID=UPI00300E354D